MPSFAQILTADENNTGSGFSDERMPTSFAKTMVASFEIDPEVASIFGDTESEDSFNGFGEISRDRGDISDIDLDDLEAEEDEAGFCQFFGYSSFMIGPFHNMATIYLSCFQ